MRCQCCNRNLSDYESTLKHPVTMEYLDICNKCLKDIPISPIPGKNTEVSSEEDNDYEPEDIDQWFMDHEDFDQ